MLVNLSGFSSPTGYIPRRPFKFGNTYKEDCDVCIDDFMNNTQMRGQEIYDLHKTVAASGRLKPVTDEKSVIKNLNDYRDRNPLRPILLCEYIENVLARGYYFH